MRAPPSEADTKMPVASAPTMPPIAWIPKASRLSSYFSAFFTTEQKKTQIGLTIRPSTRAPIGPAKPAAGVTATRPATRPEAMPSIEALLRVIHSLAAHGEAWGGGGDKGVDHSERGVAVGFQVGPGVEPEPADPQQAGADQRQGEG